MQFIFDQPPSASFRNRPLSPGFYRDRESAIAEGITIKRNAASIPDRPPETAQAIRERRKQALIDQKTPSEVE